MSLAQIAIIGLAAWRVAWMLVKEDGPRDVFKRLRARTKMGGWFGKLTISLLKCVHCLSFWLAIVFYLVYPYVPNVVQIVAVAGVASVIQHWLGLDFRQSSSET